SGIEVSKCRCRSRIGQVIRRHIDRLYGSNGSGFCRGNTLLHRTHLSGQGRLITHRRRHPSQKGRYFGTCLGKAENVVDEEQDISSLSFAVSVPEVLSEGQS